MTPTTFWLAAALMACCIYVLVDGFRSLYRHYFPPRARIWIYVPSGQWDEASLDELLEAVADPEEFEAELEVERFYDDMERWERGEG